MNVGSLFSGIGGIELGFEREGFKTLWFVENNEYCQKVLRKHWANVPIYGDIKTVAFRSLPPVDILTGGYPCQPWSKAGKRLGIKDERWLWNDFYKAICILRPKYVFMENVPEIVDFGGFSIVLKDLAKIRYDAEWQVIPASSVGAPHKRERIFSVAYPHRKRTKDNKRRTTTSRSSSVDDSVCFGDRVQKEEVFARWHSFIYSTQWLMGFPIKWTDVGP